MKKSLLLTLILLLLTVALTFSACDKTPDNPPADSESDTQPVGSESESESGSSDIVDLAEHKIVVDGVVKYSVVRVESASNELKDSVSAFHQFLTGMSSEDVVIETDFSLDYLTTGTHDASKFEIVIGNTNYEKSAEMLNGLSYGEYAIEAEGNKIYVIAPTDNGIAEALSKLMAVMTMEYDNAAKQLTVETAAIECKNVFNELLAAIPAMDNATYEFSKDGGDESMMLVFKNTKAEDFDAYTTKLLENGYKEYSSYENFGNNKFILVTKGDMALNVLYTKADSKTRVILDDLTETDLPEIDTNYTKKCESLLLQVGTAPKGMASQNGECYIFRCEDGRFIIVDGGFSGTSADAQLESAGKIAHNNAKRIYETLSKYTPTGMKPTVACWIFTHSHGDHTGAFSTFVTNYSRLVDVDQFVYNYPLDSVNNEKWTARPNARNRLDTYYPNAEIVKAHAGQTFKYANIDMEVLYAAELFWPGTVENMNEVSLVTRMSIGGQTVLMPGDMYPAANTICQKYLGSFLKSDFYAVSHHGYAGSSNPFCQMVAPTWVLWPVGEDDYITNRANSRHSWLVGSESSAKQHFPAFFNTTVFNFPFNGTNYEVYANK